MKTTALILFLLAFNFSIKAQTNLVLNPSFESYTVCPSNVGEINKAIGWETFGDSPDYYNTCASFNVGVPDNWVGHQFASSGDAYSGIYTRGNGDNYREFIGSKLTTTLSIGQKYFVSFKINRCDNFFIFSSSSNKQGVKFSTGSFSQLVPPSINNFSHVYSNSIISDSINWSVISGSFISDSAYQYITLGNFHNDINTSTSGASNQYSYYYFDDICVSIDSIYTATWTNMHQNDLSTLFKIYPNPVNNFFIVDAKDKNQKYEITIYNSLGKLIYFNELQTPLMKIESGDFESGVLTVKIVFLNNIIYRKLSKP